MILHLCVAEKFIKPFHDFVSSKSELCSFDHIFYISGGSSEFKNIVGANIAKSGNKNFVVRLMWLCQNLNKSEKIILHGLFDTTVLLMLAIQPWILKKCCWIIWGGDLYVYLFGQKNLIWWRNEVWRKFVIKRFGVIVTHIHGDYQLAKEWYRSKARWHECFVYPSNLYHEFCIQKKQGSKINILLGNSADPSNNHIEVIDSIKNLSNEKITIYCPLSYGDKTYAKEVSNYAKSIFGEKFIALNAFMPSNKYCQFLSEIDIAIFNHKRQQAMGNIISLLGMGKKVYLRKDISTWKFLVDHEITVYDVNSIDLKPIMVDVSIRNQKIVSEYFSEKSLIKQLKLLFAR